MPFHQSSFIIHFSLHDIQVCTWKFVHTQNNRGLYVQSEFFSHDIKCSLYNDMYHFANTPEQISGPNALQYKSNNPPLDVYMSRWVHVVLNGNIWYQQPTVPIGSIWCQIPIWIASSRRLSCCVPRRYSLKRCFIMHLFNCQVIQDFKPTLKCRINSYPSLIMVKDACATKSYKICDSMRRGRCQMYMHLSKIYYSVIKNVRTWDAILVDHVDPWKDPELVAATSIQLVTMLPHVEEMQ